jgi:hypothetical protein
MKNSYEDPKVSEAQGTAGRPTTAAKGEEGLPFLQTHFSIHVSFLINFLDYTFILSVTTFINIFPLNIPRSLLCLPPCGRLSLHFPFYNSFTFFFSLVNLTVILFEYIQERKN